MSCTRGVRGLSTSSNHDQTKKEMMHKILNTIANMHPEVEDDAVDDRMLVVAKEKVDHIMESVDNFKDMLDSLDTDTDVNEMINAVLGNTNSKHGRHLQFGGLRFGMLLFIVSEIILLLPLLIQLYEILLDAGLINRENQVILLVLTDVVAGILINVSEIIQAIFDDSNIAIANSSSVHGDIIDHRMLVTVTKENVVESINKEVKDVLDSLDTGTDMNDMIKAVIGNVNNKHGRHLQFDPDTVIEAIQVLLVNLMLAFFGLFWILVGGIAVVVDSFDDMIEAVIMLLKLWAELGIIDDIVVQIIEAIFDI